MHDMQRHSKIAQLCDSDSTIIMHTRSTRTIEHDSMIAAPKDCYLLEPMHTATGSY